MMKGLKLFIISLLVIAGIGASAQQGGYDVFVPIAKYISAGDAESLSAWFSDNLEISMPSGTGDCSKNQAKQILKAFFAESVPTSFTIQHQASKANVKYALGQLSCGADKYDVTVFVGIDRGRYKIQQLKFEKVR